jgi:hypothetical protein
MLIANYLHPVNSQRRCSKGSHRNDASGCEIRIVAQQASALQVFAGTGARDSCFVSVRWGAP